MAVSKKINKIILPDGDECEIEVQTQNINGVLPFSKGGTNATSLVEARNNLRIEDMEEISNSEIEDLMST